MKKKKSTEQCPLCGGKKAKGETTFTVDLQFGVIVIRNVPAQVCTQCGADWLSDQVSSRIEKIVGEAKKKKGFQIEIASYEKIAS